MSLKSLIAAFEYEVANTRKLLEAVPAKDIDYKPAATSLTMGELYHHRGEMILYLRATGNSVPGLYRPTYEERPIR